MRSDADLAQQAAGRAAVVGPGPLGRQIGGAGGAQGRQSAIEIGDRLIGYAFEQDGAVARTAVIEEAKRILAITLFGS